MMWSDFLFGVILSFLPALFCRWITVRYCVYLAKLGYAKPLASLIGLGLITALAFSTVSLVILLYVWMFGPDEPIWARPGALVGMVTMFALIWAQLNIKLWRYQASYFIEYHFPQISVIYGVPFLIISISATIFMQMGLLDLIAESAALRLKFPQLCRAVSDKDSCYRSFYIDQLGNYKKVSPKTCRGLEGHHSLDCTVHNHPHSPDVATCKLLKARNRNSSPTYYWCLSYLGALPEKLDACRRAEGSFRWVDLFFGDCINRDNVAEEVSSSKSVAMHFLDFQEGLNSSSYRNRFKIPDGLTPRMDFAKVLSLDSQLERQDREGKTVLFYVHQVKDLEALLKRKPKLSVMDEGGLTAPMHWIARENPERYLPLIEKMVAAGYDIDQQDGKRGRSLLSQYLLSLKSRPEEERESDSVLNFVSTLIKLKASPYSRDKAKKRPLDHATDLKLKRVIETFRAK